MRLIFMGTPEFSVAFLRFLAAGPHEVVAVVTQPDRPAGRGHQLKAPPVKEAALELGIPVLQPENVRDESFHQELRALQADLSIVVAFSILPRSVLALTRLGAVNLHGSLLPRYRGAAPVQWAVANGEHRTGLTVFLLDEKMDHGPMLAQESLEIGADETGYEVLMRMVPLGCQALQKALQGLSDHTIQALDQEHTQACPAPKLRKEDACLDWTLPAQRLHDRIRGFHPWPGAFTYLHGKQLNIHRTRPLAGGEGWLPGEIRVQEGHMLVGTGNGLLEILELQNMGKKPVSAAEFLRGLRILGDLRFGTDAQ